MKKRNLSRILIFITIIALLLPVGSAYAAVIDEGTDEGIAEPQTVVSYVLSFSTSNNIIGNVHVYATSSGIASYITSKITLQSASLGSSSYTDVSGVIPSTYTVYDTSSIHHLCSFPISSSRNYRIKIEITDKVNGKIATTTLYKTLSR